MKLYFARYIPVKGTIKEGDWFIFNNERKAFPCTAVYSNNVWCENLFHAHIKECRKAILFLCSRDIRIGDRVKRVGEPTFNGIVTEDYDDYSYSVKSNVKEPLEHLIPLDSVLKIIGKISPDAKWVKDGDEFDENEFTCFVDVLNIGPYSLAKIRNWKTFIIRVKGPCGHFH